MPADASFLKLAISNSSTKPDYQAMPGKLQFLANPVWVRYASTACAHAVKPADQGLVICNGYYLHDVTGSPH